MEEPEESLEDALLFALDDLRGENFKRFKNKLCFLKMEGKDRIPLSKLESADTVDTVQLLLGAYGEEGAKEVAVQVLKTINMRDSASRLQMWKQKECRKKYQRHIQDTFSHIPELNPRSGQKVSHHQRYTELFLRGRKPDPEERGHELLAMERKHQEMEAHPERCPSLGLEGLFGPDAEGRSSRTTVLFGPAGIGKTMALRKLMLDWASGESWPAKFAYAFYVSCGALNSSSETMSLVDLIANSCPPGTLAMEDILMHQDNLLIVLDAFDELNLGNLPSEGPSNDLHKRKPVTDLVLGLLRRKLFAKCHLLVATRPKAIGSLLQYLRSARCVEVLGFHLAQRKEYFQRFFEDREDGARAFELVRSNETLSRMCFLPASCSVICSIFSRTTQRDPLKDIPEKATVTDIYVWLLFKFLGCHSLVNLEGLCRLAKERLLHKTAVFDEGVLKEHGLGNASTHPGILLQDCHVTTTYKFNHLGFQELLAALSFCLLDSDGNTISSFQELEEVFGHQTESNFTLLLRFLFGLCGKRRLDILQGNWGCRTSRNGLWQELGIWLEKEVKHHSFRSEEKLLELCHCLYETEDLPFAKNIMRHIHDLDLRDLLSTNLDLAAVAFCLSASDSLQSLHLSDFELGPERLGQLLPGLWKLSVIRLNRCGLTVSTCKDLSSVVAANVSLTSLDLSENPLGDCGVTELCQGLLDSHCQLQSLQLHGCHLTAAACEPLSALLASKPSLVELNLGGNPLGDPGIHIFCKGMKNPQCGLQRLKLHQCSLTGAACTDLASVLETGPTLMELNLGDNSLGDDGVRQLCLALKKPDCKLRKLALTMGSLNRTTKTRLQAAISARPEMTVVSYYSPSFLAFPGDEGSWGMFPRS
ncbi:NACHT, LRR and PYD domains-containing protein 3 isoform X2 [Anolis carolinensis]|uniref:NACHT, LRR and PYD domains-containing protein 3 isoform X2 n=1 Tax=Anolis carolinensis TaxID=28377 RepID=UPI002F2B8682